MSAGPETTRALPAPGAARSPPAPLRHADPPALARRFAAQLGNRWLPRAVWTIDRTGRTGLIGIALLLATALFLLSTHLRVAAEVEALRADLAAAQGRGSGPAAAADKGEGPAATLRRLPPRNEMPAILRQLYNKATQARLAVDTGKYEIREVAAGGVIRYLIAFPVTGPYPQIRSFIDSTLLTMPAVALKDLVLDRKEIDDAEVEAQIGMIVYTAATARSGPPGAASAQAPPPDAPQASKARPGSDRVVAPVHAAALFAPRSWAAPPPPPPPPPPAAPPPEPTAPPLPFAFVGSFAPAGQAPVYFLARGDRVIDAHVGDRIDGVYQFESAAGGQLSFLYLPLNIRQTLASGASP